MTPIPTPVSSSDLFFKSFEGVISIFINSITKTWWLWLIILLFFVSFIIYKFYLHYKLAKTGIFEIDKMEGVEFEERLVILYSNLGYKAERTSKGNVKPDYGVDLIIEKDSLRTAVQAKRWKGSVGEDAVRVAFAAKNIYNCLDALVVTNSNFSKMAIKLAESDNVKLINRKELINLLLQEKEKLGK